MVSQTTPAKEPITEAVSLPEAFVALLIASARSDGSVSPHEANQIEHVARTSPSHAPHAIDSRPMAISGTRRLTIRASRSGCQGTRPIITFA
jgi:hypothetical protein